MDAKVDIVINLIFSFILLWNDAICSSKRDGAAWKNRKLADHSVKPHAVISKFYYRKTCDVVSRVKALKKIEFVSKEMQKCISFASVSQDRHFQLLTL